MEAITIKQLGKTFHTPNGSVKLFSDLGFTIHQGDVIGIIGKNGAGKSTLLKTLSGIIKPSSGSVEIYGKLNSIIDLGQNMNPDLTGLQNLSLNLKINGFSKAVAQQKINEVLAIAELGEAIHQQIKNYSSGMLFRLGFALQTVVDCDILLVDEIISVGDLQFRNQCDTIIRNFIAHGKTLLLASHDIDTISSICNKCLLLHKGEFLFGETSNVIRFYKQSIEGTKPEHTIGNEQIFYAQAAAAEKNASLISVEQPNGKAKINFDQPLTLAIRYRVNTPMVMGITLSLFFQQKIPLLSSCMQYVHYNNQQVLLHQPGEYHLAVTFPAGLLAPGTYSVDLAFHDNQEMVFKNHKTAYIFQIEANESLLSVFKKSLPPFPLLPALEWQFLTDKKNNNSIFKNPNLQQGLYTAGYVKMPAVTLAIVAAMRAFYFQMFPEIEADGQNNISIIHESVGVREKCQTEILRLLSGYMEEHFKNFKIILATFFAKPLNHESCVGYHQDPTFTDPEKFDDYTLWIPLEDILEGDGELVVIPNSHTQFHKINFFSSPSPYLALIKEQDEVLVPSPSGHPVMFFNRTVHGSKQNGTKDIRVAVSIKICHQAAKLYSYFNSELPGKAERYSQPECFYLNADWDETKRPSQEKLNGMVDLI